MRSALDGTAKTAIVSERIDSPNGIAVDYEKQVVYWVDGTGDTLEMVNYDGRLAKCVLMVNCLPAGTILFLDTEMVE